MLKRRLGSLADTATAQPPLGGCVLKQRNKQRIINFYFSAAFRRLCVETTLPLPRIFAMLGQPPLGGCVLKPDYWAACLDDDAVSRL